MSDPHYEWAGPHSGPRGSHPEASRRVAGNEPSEHTLHTAPHPERARCERSSRKPAAPVTRRWRHDS